jgi:hypothetical protein
MATLSSGLMQQQIDCMRRAEIKGRIARAREQQCQRITQTEGRIESKEAEYSTIHTQVKISQCPMVVSNISPGAVESGLYLRNKQLSCDTVQAPPPIQVQRIPAPAPCTLPSEYKNAGMPVPTPFLRCVPPIVGFT